MPCERKSASSQIYEFIIGSKVIRSCEGTIQGDPVTMAAYAITVIPMIQTIVDITSKIDDSTKTAD